MKYKTTIFIFLFLFSLNFAVADFGYKDNSKPILEAPQSTSVTIEINDSLLNVNNSDLLDGTDWDEHINGSANQLCYFDGENSVKGTDTIDLGETKSLISSNPIEWTIFNPDSRFRIIIFQGKIYFGNDFSDNLYLDYEGDENDFNITLNKWGSGGNSFHSYIPIYVSNNLSAQCYTFMDGTTQCSASSGGGFTTDQNDELNTTGSPTFDDLNITGNLYIKAGMQIKPSVDSVNTFNISNSTGGNVIRVDTSSREVVIGSLNPAGFWTDANQTGTQARFSVDGDMYTNGLIYMRSNAPGFWLEEVGASNRGVYLSYDNYDLQWQRRGQNFSTYETTFMRWHTSAPGNSFLIDYAGRVSFGGVGNPSASVHLPAGRAGAGYAPLMFNQSIYILSTPVVGSVEYNQSAFWLTINQSSLATRYNIPLTNNTNSWTGYGVCYLPYNVLGHCTDALNASGSCTCIGNY